MQEDAIKRLRIEATEKGISETTQKVGQLTKAEVDLETAQLRRAAAQVQLVNAQNRQMMQYQRMLQTQEQFTAANDNSTSSISHMADALRVAAKSAAEQAASWIATTAAVSAGLIIFSEVLGILGRLIITFKLASEVVALYAQAWKLAGERLEEYRQIAQKAAAAGLTTEYFQRITKAATDAKAPIDALTESFKNLGKATSEKLGGSEFQKKLEQLQGFGNFSGNTGVKQFGLANNATEQMKAIFGNGGLFDQAVQKGERLAALDLTKTFLPAELQTRLENDSNYMRDILASAEKISATKLVSDADIGNALELQRRYDEAVKILEQRWHPIQELLIQGGIKLREIWVSIVEAVANVVDQVSRLIIKIADLVGGPLKTVLNVGATVVAATAKYNPVLGPAVGGVAGAIANATSDSVQETDALTDAKKRLAAALQNTYGVQQKMNEASTVANKALGDQSKSADNTVKAVAQQRSAYELAVAAVERHTQRTLADVKAVGLGAGAQAEFRARTQLTLTALQAGIPITAAMSAQIEELSKAAGEAGLALEKAKVASDIKFTRDTAFLSPEDLQIAQQLRGLYGNDIPAAMASSEAAAMRVNNAIKDTRDTAQEFTKDLVRGLMQGKTGMEALANAATNLSNKLTEKAITALFSGDLLTAAVAGIGAVVSGVIGKNAQQAADLEKAKKAWEDMAGQVTAFNQAAAGFDLGPLTSQLNSLFATLNTLSEAAYKAKDMQGLASLQTNFVLAAVRITEEFKNGAQNLTPLEQTIRDLNNEAAGLIETLNNLKLGDLAAQVGPALQARINAAIAADAAERKAAESLQIFNSQLRILQAGTDASTLEGQLRIFDMKAQAEMDAAKAAGNTTESLNILYIALLAERRAIINTAEAAQKAAAATEKLNLQMRLLSATTDSSTLAGALTIFDAKAKQEYDAAVAAGSQNLTLLLQVQAAERQNIIQDFAQKAIDAEKQLADQRLAQMQRIKEYLDNLTGGSQSTLAPVDRLSAASSQYSTQLGLAKSGDANALSSITSYSQNVLDAARDYYGSTSGYQTIFAQVQKDLQALIGLTGAGSAAAATSGSISSAASSIGGVTPITSSPAAANTDSWAALKAEIADLKTTLKAAIDTNTQAISIAHEEEQVELESIDVSLATLAAVGKLA